MSVLRDWAGLARSLVIYRSRPWKIARLARFYAGFLGPGDLAFDIGAHVGNRTNAMLRTGARVVAVEPQRFFHRFLRWDLPSSAVLLPVAIGAGAGTAPLLVSRLHPTVSSLAPDFAGRMAEVPGFRHVRWDASEHVEVTTLDALIATHGCPKFIKIDVEGHEAAVLRGLGRPIAWIAFEYLPAAAEVTKACVARLTELGRYEYNFIEGEAAEFALDEWAHGGELALLLAERPRGGDIYARLRDA